MLHSKLNKIEKWCLYCFMIFCDSKVNGPAVVGFTDSQMYNFVASNSVILHICFEREKNEKKRKKHGY